MHKRKLIREAIVSLLKANVTDVSERVFESRSSSIWESNELPCIAVYTKNETSEEYSDFPKILNRKLNVNIEVYAEAKTDVDDTIDGLCEAIESAMNLDLKLSGNAYGNTLVGTEIVVSEEGKKPVGAARLAYQIDYQTIHQSR